MVPPDITHMISFTTLSHFGAGIDFRANYIYGIGNGYILRNTPLNAWPQCIDMGIGHKGTKVYKKQW